ncbi:Similar to IQCA1L: IQ and AAA domain-containing protein 1-like (Homo sapiens) [Cotesia congregata]|uniref:Similar to IQCA1L: IQ and AAA domain-containing protein 1-like (Homo sapiens) n=1 Tax=Cotesia congregata TaxID=51543 RepID=A0A8J2HEV1_COTCN|nr:Similar to IQCA1L: IQ and AAA domain-containing protein 1-like (Homo sapiens) [Cotesia congregata]
MKLTPDDIDIPIPSKRKILQSRSDNQLAKAVLMIQKHERARAARRKFSSKVAPQERRSIGFEDLDKFCKAVVTVQRFWRGYHARKLLRHRKERLDEVLGLVPGVRDIKVLNKDQENFNRRLELQAQVQEVPGDEKNRIFEEMEPGLMEDITDELREWFRIWYQEVGHFGTFPPADQGGSVLIVTEQAGQVVPIEGPDSELDRPESEALDTLVRLSGQSSEDLELDDDVYYQVQLEARRKVDDLMREELKRLNKALVKDLKKNKVKSEVPKPKKRKKKKKKTKGVDGSKVKEMYDELVGSGIIRSYPITYWDQWVGDTSYKWEDMARNARLGDVKRAVIDHCVLPLITKEAHKLAPLIRSVCIAGLPGSGKSMLANIISSLTGAILMDLTPGNLDGYRGKKNEKRLVKMVIAVGRSYPQAVIILIDGGDKPWWKKLPPEDKEAKPKRIKKLLKKIRKSIKSGDQLLILGLASAPWKTSKPFYSFYTTFIVIPPTDPSSLNLFYQQTLSKHSTFPELSCLSRFSNYPLGAVQKAIEALPLNTKTQLPLTLARAISAELTYSNPTQLSAIKQFKKFENKPKNERMMMMMKKGET